MNSNQSFITVGKSPLRADARDKVRGKGIYIDDMRLPGMLYGKVLRSQYAHARILMIDTSEAERLPGIIGIVTGEELPFIHGESFPDEPLLARGKVRYMGEGVAAVAAVDEETAEKALGLIKVEYEELPALFDPVAAAAPGAVRIHEEMESYKGKPLVRPVKGTNILNHVQFERGDVNQGFAQADHIFEDTFTTPAQQHCSIEPHGSICLIDKDDNISLWTNNDSPYRCRIEIADALHIPMTKVRIISAPYTGGNFGGKGGLKAEACAIALAWKIRNVPIKVLYTREEEFCSSIIRHPSVIKIKTGVKNGGTILAREVTTYWATGAYAEKGPTVSRFGGISSAGPYNIPNVKINGYLVYTNTPVAGAMRGYSGPQTSWAYESQMDIIAAKLGLDPLELRLRHVYQDGDIHTATGQIIHAEGLKKCLEEVAVRMEWQGKTLGPNQGRGIACMERAVKTPFGSAAFVKVNEDGTVDILSSTTEVGQGSETILRQIVAEELGVPLNAVRKATPDTAYTPYDASTTSSRSTFHMGNAVKIAAADARQQILQLAGKLLSTDPVNLTLADGKVLDKENPVKVMPIAAVLGQSYGSSGTVLGRGYYFPEMPEGQETYFSSQVVFWLLGAHGIEVEVNRRTGEVKILKVYAAHDAGKAIHPDNVKGQILGGISMGLGYAAYENYEFKEGNVLNPSFLSYKLPTAVDMPGVVPVIVEQEHQDGPYGAKGVGETTNVPLPPALANAIYNAVGIRIKSLPITPDKVLAAMQERGEGESQ
ncbi:xanthine dehydrogenase family protein molybdopterin-binding subunit [Paradesulfitobacterium ferrireducens]|uniref:xanthine dehydrogenase family protein molybdopterin-binding subunit n=1 Tax=Paradesulfitobacterium ferrireducens TaxID=2816476 RepID=UPI001A8C561E|nr:xanthine dehydrogenase family protein molybdopterin-binding subunit [Paradesulfitobacterium ferrireducens]